MSGTDQRPGEERKAAFEALRDVFDALDELPERDAMEARAACVASAHAALPGLTFIDGSPWGSCPVQIDGLLPDGRRFYFRYRSDTASLRVWDDPSVEYAPDEDVTAYATLTDVIGEDYAGTVFDLADLPGPGFGGLMVSLIGALAAPDPDSNPMFGMRLNRYLHGLGLLPRDPAPLTSGSEGQ